MIRPGFWQDEKLAKVSRESRLTFIGIWTACDDYGVCKSHHIWLRNQIFPYDDIPADDIKKWLQELEDIGVILSFEHHGEGYYFVKNFNIHQKVDHPSKDRNPFPSDSILHDSRKSRESLASPPLPTEQNRREVNRTEEKLIESRIEANSANASENDENGKLSADLLNLPFEKTFDCLCYILAEYDKAKGEKAKQTRRTKAESLIQKYSEDHVKDKLFHFLWVARYKPALLGDKPTGYLIKSIQEPYPPPAGYEEWQEKALTAKRKSEKSFYEE
jgi:hypothetical protein